MEPRLKTGRRDDELLLGGVRGAPGSLIVKMRFAGVVICMLLGGDALEWACNREPVTSDAL